VTLSGFTATAQGHAALLQWSTTEQTGFSSFSVERSADGMNFSAVGTVAATAGTTSAEQYTFTDNDPLPGMNYYRLAMIDLDGATAWSEIRSVGFSTGTTALALSVYPNPVVSTLHLALTGASGTVVIRLLNSQGQLLRTLNAVAPADLEISMNGLANGIYFLAIDGTNGHDVRKIMKD
jgi:hypothetical protein